MTAHNCAAVLLWINSCFCMYNWLSQCYPDPQTRVWELTYHSTPCWPHWGRVVTGTRKEVWAVTPLPGSSVELWYHHLESEEEQSNVPFHVVWSILHWSYHRNEGNSPTTASSSGEETKKSAEWEMCKGTSEKLPSGHYFTRKLFWGTQYLFWQ